MTMTRVKSSSFSIACLIMSAVAACGGGSSTGTGGGGGGGGPPVLTVVAGAPSPPSMEPVVEDHTIEGYATALGDNGSLVAAGTSTSLYEVTSAGPVLLDIVGDEPDLPATTGAVRALAPNGSGLLVAAETGLFYTEGGVIQRSLASSALFPLGITAMASRLADDDGDGANETHLLLRVSDGVREVEGDALITWTIEGEAGLPTALLGQKERLYLAYGSRVYEVDRASEKAYPLTFDVGYVKAMACNTLACDEGSIVYFASDKGLVERSASGAYTRYPLANEGDPAVTVEGFAFDAGRQRLYALAGGLVILLRDGEVPKGVATLGPPASGGEGRSMAADKIGDLWVGEGLGLTRLAIGTPLSFATDVAPIMHTYCAGCHATAQNGAPTINFEAYNVMVDKATVALTRMKEGTMPPATYEKKLPKEKIQIIEDWAVGKAP